MMGLTAWLNPGRWLLLAAVLAALVFGVKALDNSRQAIGYNRAVAEYTAAALVAAEAARLKSNALSKLNEGNDRDYQIDKTRRAAAERVVADGLRSFQAAAAVDGSNDTAAASGTDDPYRAIADQCAAALVRLDGYASSVAGKTKALQGYAREVCVSQ